MEKGLAFQQTALHKTGQPHAKNKAEQNKNLDSHLTLDKH